METFHCYRSFLTECKQINFGRLSFIGGERGVTMKKTIGLFLSVLLIVLTGLSLVGCATKAEDPKDAIRNPIRKPRSLQFHLIQVDLKRP